jgi:hypothetical protein
MQWVLHSPNVWICSLRYPACNAHAPYCHLWPTPLYNIFPNYLLNSRMFEEKTLLGTKCVLIFGTIFVWNISRSRKIISEIWIKIYVGLYVKYLLFLPNFNDTWIFSTVFKKKASNISFKENPPVGAELFRAYGRTDIRTGVTKLMVAFSNFVTQPKNIYKSLYWRSWSHWSVKCSGYVCQRELMYTLRRFEPYAEPELSCGSQHGDPTWKTDDGSDRGVMCLVWARKLSTTPAIHSWLIVQR